MSGTGLDWRGEELLRRVQQAFIEAVDETTAACVPIGQALVHVDTGLLQSRIGTIPAQVRGDQIVGGYGVPEDPGYAIPQEYAPGPRGRAYIRPAADQEFPKLEARIARRLGQ